VKILLEFFELLRIDAGLGLVDGEGELGFPLLEFALEYLSGARDGVALAIEKTLDAHRHLDVAAAVETLAGATFVRFELRKFALPKTKNVGRNIAELGHFADPEIELVRDVRSRGWGGFADWLVLRHARNSVTALPAVVACDPASGKYRPTL
jgi:hypothetical protein